MASFFERIFGAQEQPEPNQVEELEKKKDELTKSVAQLEESIAQLKLDIGEEVRKAAEEKLEKGRALEKVNILAQENFRLQCELDRDKENIAKLRDLLDKLKVHALPTNEKEKALAAEIAEKDNLIRALKQSLVIHTYSEESMVF